MLYVIRLLNLIQPFRWKWPNDCKQRPFIRKNCGRLFYRLGCRGLGIQPSRSKAIAWKEALFILAEQSRPDQSELADADEVRARRVSVRFM